MQEVETIIFLEIIQTEGALFITEHFIDGVRIQYFLSVNRNKRVAIVVSEESINRRTASAYLNQLGLSDLVERMFGN